MDKKPIITLIIVTIISAIFIAIGWKAYGYMPPVSSEMESFKGTVTEIVSKTESDGYQGLKETQVTFNLKIVDEIFTATQIIDSLTMNQTAQVKPNDKVIVAYDGIEGSQALVYVSHNHIGGMIFMCMAFFAVIITIGKVKGIATIITLFITIGTIFFVYIPGILRQVNVYSLTMIIAIFIILTSLIALNGINKKTLCAVVGNVGGVIMTGVLTIFANNAFNITGLVSDEYMKLSLLENVSLDLKSIVWGAIIIGSLGAIMDVSMSIASAMEELSQKMRDKSYKSMVTSGMNIGKDAIGTMTNTLILAYIGSSLAMVILFMAYQKDLAILLNLEMIIVEIMQSVLGSMGILFAVPSTVFFAAWVYNIKCSKNN